jgi:hypothetical protein
MCNYCKHCNIYEREEISPSSVPPGDLRGIGNRAVPRNPAYWTRPNNRQFLDRANLCAQQLGATGLTFFDDEVIEVFSPHAKGKSTIFITRDWPLKRKSTESCHAESLNGTEARRP